MPLFFANSGKALSVWIVCVCFYLYEFMLRTLLGTFQTPIMKALALNATQFALLSSTAYLFVYGSMQIPVGICIDRFGLKKSLAVASACCAVACFGFSLAQSLTFAIICRILMGFGSSFGFIGVLVAVYDWMPRYRIAFFIGLSQFFGTLGPMLAGGPLSSLAESNTINWRFLFSILSLVGMVLSCLIFLFVDKNRAGQESNFILSRPSNILLNLRLVAQQPQIWFIAVFGAFVYFGLEYLSENECKNFLLQRGFNSVFGSFMITIAWLGFALSSPISGFVSDYLNRRKPLLYFSAITTCCALLAIVYLPIGKILTTVFFLLLGMGVGAASIAIAMMSEQCKASYLAAGLGFNNGFTMLLVSILAPFMGQLLHLQTIFFPNDPLAQYQHAFLPLLILPIIALLVVVFCIRETYAKSTKENLILTIK